MTATTVNAAHQELVSARQALAAAKQQRAADRLALGRAMATFNGFRTHEDLAREFQRTSVEERRNPPAPGPAPKFASELDRIKASKPHPRRGQTGLVRGGYVQV
jgi:hypothetical protein